MKITKYIILLLCVAFAAVGCYKDKGEYSTASWTSIVSVENMTIDGYEGGLYSFIEGDVISCSPTINFKSGVDESKILYRWVLGGDTISRSKELNWTVIYNPKIDPDRLQYLYLIIDNRATGEVWQQTFMDKSSTIGVKIIPARLPKVGVFVYEKADNTIEYGTVRGTSESKPQDYNTIYTDLYSYYNPSMVVPAPLAASTINGSMLFCHTNIAPDNGAIVSTSSTAGSKTLGQYMGSIAQQVFLGEPLKGDIKSVNTYLSGAKEMLVGTNLYVATSTNDAYIPVGLNTVPTKSDVEQIMTVNPDNNVLIFGIYRTTAGDIIYYPPAKMSKCTPLMDENGAALKADEIVGVFRQPKLQPTDKTKLFVATRKGAQYLLYEYNLTPYSSSSSADDAVFSSKTDVTAWAGGMNSSATWFTNSMEVPMNYIYIANGNKLWRTGSMTLAEPTAVKTFDDPISTISVVAPKLGSPTAEMYTAVFTYNAVRGESKLQFLDLRDEVIITYSEIETPIKGKVVKYIPVY